MAVPGQLTTIYIDCIAKSLHYPRGSLTDCEQTTDVSSPDPAGAILENGTGEGRRAPGEGQTHQAEQHEFVFV